MSAKSDALEPARRCVKRIGLTDAIIGADIHNGDVPKVGLTVFSPQDERAEALRCCLAESYASIFPTKYGSVELRVRDGDIVEPVNYAGQLRAGEEFPSGKALAKKADICGKRRSIMALRRKRRKK